ncbi:MAG: RraA family protein [Bacteroidales bacterium]|nr:RraA family protein [Bacteroidales bacterium]
MKTSILVLLAFFISPFIFSQDVFNLTDDDLIKLYEGLRVADVSDGMDLVGLHDQGLMDQSIEALWKDIDQFTHQFCGIALTVRYVPTNKKFPTDLTKEEYENWRDQWYGQLSPEPFLDSIQPGKVLVIDNTGDGDTGSAGSFNSLIWTQKGMVGLVSTGGVRDTDEIIKQGIPVYMNLSNRGRGIRPGRNEIESVNQPVVVGDVLVHPGDIVVADGDGVIIVPREFGVQVAKAAYEILNVDKAGRKRLYEELGIPLDFTVE